MAGTRTRERGELEAEIMRLLWAAEEPVSAKELQLEFSGHQPAYTTLMTALTRLEQKSMVVRSGTSPRKVRFAAAQAGEAHTSDEMMSALTRSADRRAALLAFAGSLDEEDISLLRTSLQARTPKS